MYHRQKNSRVLCCEGRIVMCLQHLQSVFCGAQNVYDKHGLYKWQCHIFYVWPATSALMAHRAPWLHTVRTLLYTECLLGCSLTKWVQNFTQASLCLTKTCTNPFECVTAVVECTSNLKFLSTCSLQYWRSFSNVHL